MEVTERTSHVHSVVHLCVFGKLSADKVLSLLSHFPENYTICSFRPKKLEVFIWEKSFLFKGKHVLGRLRKAFCLQQPIQRKFNFFCWGFEHVNFLSIPQPRISFWSLVSWLETIRRICWLTLGSWFAPRYVTLMTITLSDLWIIAQTLGLLEWCLPRRLRFLVLFVTKVLNKPDWLASLNSILPKCVMVNSTSKFAFNVFFQVTCEMITRTPFCSFNQKLSWI